MLEDLNVKGMVRNHHLAKAISDVAFGEIRRQIEYKAQWQGEKVIIADRWDPSSRKCSVCGVINKKLKLSDRKWVCMNCGTLHDRDENAAKNLEALGLPEPRNGRGLPVEGNEGHSVKQEDGSDLESTHKSITTLSGVHPSVHMCRDGLMVCIVIHMHQTVS